MLVSCRGWRRWNRELESSDPAGQKTAGLLLRQAHHLVHGRLARREPCGEGFDRGAHACLDVKRSLVEKPLERRLVGHCDSPSIVRGDEDEQIRGR